MKIASYTLGCKVNSYETSAIIEIFKNKGFEIVDFDDVADVYLINTCTVTNQSDVKCRKIIRQALRRGIVAVMGCYSQMKPDVVKSLGVDIVIGTTDRKSIVDLIINKLVNNASSDYQVIDSRKIVKFENLEATEFDRTRAYLKIQDGCNNFCSYCIIPFARGRARSRDLDNVLEECVKITEKGYKEIVLTGIHTGGYGEDLGVPFSLLVEKILDNTPLLERLRISSIEINQIDDKLLEILKKNKKLCHHLHLPIQSASNKVLKDMNRKYNVDEFIEKINKIRSYVPDISITTDIIIGYPTETEEDFLETLENISKIQFSFMHIFPFSKREKTVASKYDEINGLIMKDRIKRISELNIVYAKKYASRFINKTLDFIPEEYENGYLIGHTNNFLKVRAAGNSDEIGQMCEIMIENPDFPQNSGKIL